MLRLLREEAERRGISVAGLVREAIEFMLRYDREARLQAARSLFEVGEPVAEWPQMEREITEARTRTE